MEKIVAGDIVVVAFPFSDYSQMKRRPAVVMSSLMGEDFLLCAITTQTARDDWTIDLFQNDFSDGKLDVDSFIRCNKIGSFDQKTILYKIGSLKKKKFEQAVNMCRGCIGN